MIVPDSTAVHHLQLPRTQFCQRMDLPFNFLLELSSRFAAACRNHFSIQTISLPATIPTRHVVTQPYPVKNLDFTSNGAYSIYNWELFFHAPLLIAIHLSQNQKFQDAQNWFHYIFNPTDNSPGPDARSASGRCSRSSTPTSR